MLLLTIGVVLWVVGHLWRRFLPAIYANAGKAGYGISAVIILASLALMYLGYSGARGDYVHLWAPPPFAFYINNLLVVFAFYTYFATATPRGTVWLVGNLKHPQLTGFKIWAIAHLLVNGDLASLILFGGLLGWAVLEVILINRQGEKFDRSKAKVTSRWGHLAIVVVALLITVSIHAWVGINPIRF